MSDTPSLTWLSPGIAAGLILQQFPELAVKKVLPMAAVGTDNFIFRIGDDLCARFPKAAWAAGTARREVSALPRFAGAPLAVPEVYGLGRAGAGYPNNWSVLTWLPGTPLEDSALEDPAFAARQLAGFLRHVREAPVDPAFSPGPDNNGRGAPLATRTDAFNAALPQLPDVNLDWAMRLWSQALRAGQAEEVCWLHGDVHPGNVLVEDGRVSGVIDWGLCGVGDGACDLLTAWAMFDAAPRDVFRKAMGASDAEWLRGAGWALSMAVIYLPYAYEHDLRSDMSERILKRLREEFT
ncbi:MAG: aminoglycoside phosphotransferase family protein [Hyphomonas sp.]